MKFKTEQKTIYCLFNTRDLIPCLHYHFVQQNHVNLRIFYRSSFEFQTRIVKVLEFKT